jgi:hypothetical protein
VVPTVGAPTTAFATEAYTLSPDPTISVPVPNQLGSSTSASGRGLETPPMVSDRAALTIVVPNYWSFSISLRSAVVHYRPLLFIPSCKQPQN